MKRQVLFVQGAGQGTHSQWDNKLADSLRAALEPDYDILYPPMPNEADPSYPLWKAALETEFAKLQDGAMLVGHSVGATILVNALAASPPPFKPGGIFLIAAPFVGDGGWPSEDIEPLPDLGGALPQKIPVYLYYGSADDTVPPSHADLYASAIPQATIRHLDGRDHQLNDDLREVAADILSVKF